MNFQTYWKLAISHSENCTYAPPAVNNGPVCFSLRIYLLGVIRTGNENCIICLISSFIFLPAPRSSKNTAPFIHFSILLHNKYGIHPPLALVTETYYSLELVSAYYFNDIGT